MVVLRMDRLPSFHEERTHTLNVVVETPRGSRNRYEYDGTAAFFRLVETLPAGLSFPYDSGFVPSTQGSGDSPLEVVLLLDESTFPGCLVEARLVGVVEGEQSTGEETVRNDRLIAVAVRSNLYRDVRSLSDFSEALLEGVIQFFASYCAVGGKMFVPLGRYDGKRALTLVETARQQWKKSNRKKR